MNLIERNLGGILELLGIETFICADPVAITDFDASQLEGSWYQSYASRGSDVYGCLQYQFVYDESQNAADIPAVNVNTSWTAFNTYWNPLQKGQFARTYKLYGDSDGRMFERSALTRETTFSRVLDTDYSTYFVEYACKQSWGDLWTIEYVDIFTKDGLISSSSKSLDDIKTTMAGYAPNFDVESLAEVRSADGCPYQTVWGIF